MKQPDLFERKRFMPRNGTTTYTSTGKPRSLAEWEKAAKQARKEALKHGLQLELLDAPQSHAKAD